MTKSEDELKNHRFGGCWTEAKLEVLRKYLSAYVTALRNKPSKDKPFIKAYIDAFAGTGYRSAKHVETENPAQICFNMPDLADQEPQEWRDGSARIALKIEPCFDKYIFIERNRKRAKHLEDLKNEFPKLSESIQVRQADANEEIKRICACSPQKWKNRRAVLFLDPYGMAVEWSTVEAVARTRAIDLWLLLPLGMGVNRLLPKSGQISDPWRDRLNRCLGTEDWYDEFYEITESRDLFGQTTRHIRKESIDVIARYCNNRLKTIFSGVAEQPGVLRNSRNNPLYLFCFAVGNERGREPALNIANDLLEKLR